MTLRYTKHILIDKILFCQSVEEEIKRRVGKRNKKRERERTKEGEKTRKNVQVE